MGKNRKLNKRKNKTGNSSGENKSCTEKKK